MLASQIVVDLPKVLLLLLASCLPLVCMVCGATRLQKIDFRLEQVLQALVLVAYNGWLQRLHFLFTSAS